MQKITDNVYVETGFCGCNTSFVVTREGVVLIDTPTVPAEAKKWRDEIAKFGPLRYVINTEPHTDHAAGNYWFDAPVIAHEGTRQAMAGARVEEVTNMLRMMAPDSLPLDPAFSYKMPGITFANYLTLYLGDHTFQLIHTPGHTASEVTVYVPEEKVVFTGDNMNMRMPIFINSLPFDWVVSLKRVRQMDVNTVVPGHGDVGDKNSIDRMIDAVQYWIDSLTPAVRQGWSLEETVQKVTLAERYPGALDDPRTGGMMKRSLIDLYQTLKK